MTEDLFLSCPERMGNRKPALLWWLNWHHSCTARQWESGGISHIFAAFIFSPYWPYMTGSFQQQ